MGQSSSQSFVDVCNRELSQFTIFVAEKYSVLLGINDHNAVYSKVRSISASWKPFARSLWLSPNTINLIDANNRDCESCMSKALEYWLRKDYNYSVYGVPCWRMACVAVKEGGGDTALAEEIAREHPLPASRETTPSGQAMSPGRSTSKWLFNVHCFRWGRAGLLVSNIHYIMINTKVYSLSPRLLKF